MALTGGSFTFDQSSGLSVDLGTRSAEIDIDLTQLIEAVNTLEVTVDVYEYVSDSINNVYSHQLSKQFQVICLSVELDPGAVDVVQDLHLQDNPSSFSFDIPNPFSFADQDSATYTIVDAAGGASI